MTTVSSATSPRKSPAKFRIHHDESEAGVELTPKATGNAAGLKRGLADSAWYGPPPSMALLTTKMANLAHERTVVSDEENDCTQKKLKFENHFADIENVKAQRTDKLVTSLDKADSHKATSSAQPLRPKVVMPIGSQRPKATVKPDVTEAILTPPSDTQEPSTEPSPKMLNDSPLMGLQTSESELEVLKKELAAARNKIAAMDQELIRQRITNDSLDILRSPSASLYNFHDGDRASGVSLPHEQIFDAGYRNASPFPDYAPGTQGGRPGPSQYHQPSYNNQAGVVRSAWNGPPFAPQPQRPAHFGSYPGSSIAPSPAGYSPSSTPMSMSMSSLPPYRLQPTPLSPEASEFNLSSSSSITNPSGVASDTTSTYFAAREPMPYRTLIDRNQTADWKYIVDKIVCSNDQQSSIFLQQKLKVATADQKYDMIECIIQHAYPLMINRFGNFLIQRCLEHGTPEQVVAIASSIRGNVLNLSMDAFGCHVVQKALDVVPEAIKASMVQELLHRIPETVIHRYACHVWQKLFELRWCGTPPQIMKRVNESLRGMWHEVALGETGSLVVQNIFENCLEEDKRPCINEVLASIDLIAHGQFGNWCIQHICEHGQPADRSRAIEHVLRFAADYSIDQFASKVVEKCLKVGGPEFMDRYLERVCEGRVDRPRMPLIDIAGDQFGNYIVQYILINANPHHREMVCNHIRKHMVSLRGSKFGSRVAMLCTNPAFTSRPGPSSGAPMMNSRFLNGPPMGPTIGRPMQSAPYYRYGSSN